MTKIVGLWDGKTDHDNETIEPQDSMAYSEPDYSYMEAERAPSPLIPVICLLLAIAWLGFVGWTARSGFAGQAPTAPQIGALIATASAPLALIGVLYLLLMRTSRTEARRFGATAEAMRTESAALEARLAAFSHSINENRTNLAAQADYLLSLGDDTIQRMSSISAAMRAESDVIGRQAETLKSSAADAQADMATLLGRLPEAHSQTRQIAETLQETGSGAIEKVAALESQLSSLAVRGREADEIAAGAAQQLAAQLQRIEDVSGAAQDRIDTAASQMNSTIDSAFSRAAEAADEARQAMETQGTAMLAMVEQSKALFERVGTTSADGLARRLAEISGQVEALGDRLSAHDNSGRALVQHLADGLADVEMRLAALDMEGTSRTERLASAVTGLTNHADRLTLALNGGGAAADNLIARSETLLTALDASAREIDETLPAAFARLETTAGASRERIAALAPGLGGLETSANAAFDRLVQTEKLLTQQREAVELLANAAEQQLAAGTRHAEDLTTAIGVADGQAKALAEGAGPSLIEVMLRVRDTAAQAAERAREALDRIIPDAAQALGKASDDAMRKAVTDRVETQMAAIAQAAERAAEAANLASGRLDQQLSAIGNAATEMEGRFSAGQAEIEEANRENFARRVSLLIEALNSTAIDVTKVLSNEVTDSAWAAYLKGDRGVFTRRAVKLLDAGEAREIVRYYEADPEFRDQVNRYIHDFEAMLRAVLATREGAPMGVTILSSDMGKLYVALAQAIDKLRN